MSPTKLPKPKALLFDFMGTCLDWRSGMVMAFQKHFDGETAMDLTNTWRSEYFKEARKRTDAGLVPEDIDITHRRVLDQLLDERTVGYGVCGEEAREQLVRQWHVQTAWPDMAPALARLQPHFDTLVHANGSTRLQVDLIRSSGLHFHYVISSVILGVAKPDPKNYLRVAELLKLKPEDCMTVAAHAYDTQGAKEVGMQTAYIWRETEDLDEDMQDLERRFDYFVDGRGGGVDVGLSKLADVFLQT